MIAVIIIINIGVIPIIKGIELYVIVSPINEISVSLLLPLLLPSVSWQPLHCTRNEVFHFPVNVNNSAVSSRFGC